MYKMDQALETPDEGSFVAVEVTAMYNPAHFYLTFPYGTKTVNELYNNSADDCNDGSTDGKLPHSYRPK